MVIISIAYGLGYMVYMSLGLWHPQNKKPFRKLFNNRTFFIHFLVQVFVSVFAYLRCLSGHYEATFLFVPLVYLILLRVLDPIIVKLAGRHIYFVGRGDARPRDYNWFLDAPICILITLLPMINSMFLVNYFKFGHYGISR
jgi:hypothetical protein